MASLTFDRRAFGVIELNDSTANGTIGEPHGSGNRRDPAPTKRSCLSGRPTSTRSLIKIFCDRSILLANPFNYLCIRRISSNSLKKTCSSKSLLSIGDAILKVTNASEDRGNPCLFKTAGTSSRCIRIHEEIACSPASNNCSNFVRGVATAGSVSFMTAVRMARCTRPALSRDRS